MKKLLMIALAALLVMPIMPRESVASTAECEIWLCLPGGFPNGCGAAYSAFKSRIKRGKSPLPPLSVCGSKSTGNYKMGFERFEACREGYNMVGSNTQYSNRDDGPTQCVQTQCRHIGSGRDREERCERYNPTPKAKPYFIQLWIDGAYQGKHYFDLR